MYKWCVNFSKKFNEENLKWKDERQMKRNKNVGPFCYALNFLSGYAKINV